MTASEVNKSQGTAREKKNFRPSDWKHIAEYICSTLDDRKRNRAERERVWKEVDRQIAMRPDTKHKQTTNDQGIPTGRIDPERAWMPEIELPWQATALEILTADARRMMFPDAGPWYEAFAEMDDETLRALENGAVEIAGADFQLPSLIDQDNLNKFVLGVGGHWKRQYDFDATYDATNAEAFKYGTGIARWCLVEKSVFAMTARGVVKENQLIPVRVPRTIKNTYLDDSQHEVLHEGHMLGPLIIAEKRQRLEDVIMAASAGNDDPDSYNGGWMAGKLRGMNGDDSGLVEIIEAEGDFAVPRKTGGSLVLRGAIITVCVGRDGKERDQRVVRFRWRKTKGTTYEVTPYHVEDVDCAYASGILTKAWPVQVAAVDAQNRMMEVGALNAQPPLGWDRSDANMAAEGGPVVRPGELWETNSPVTVHQIGELASAMQVYVTYAQQYSDLTGINAARLGAQTVSHTTAFAKDAELSRGTVRTVDYVRSAIKGGMTRGLCLEYEMGREAFKKSTIYIDAYKGFVTVEKKGLPQNVVFMAHGAAGPAEEQQKKQNRLQSAMMAVQLETLNVQLGGAPQLNVRALQEQTLREGGWSDTEPFFNSDGAAAAAPGGPGVPGNNAVSPGPAIAALQAVRG